ncbi:MAG: leucine-rich repeat domain-containing protein [Ruminococcus sp.]|nr:leucine-rich repeat domain-containing protein [Ruminococcus sp.]
MKVQYRQIKNGIEIVRCYGTDSCVVLPREVEGQPVTRVAAYAFSARKWEEDTDVQEYQCEDTFLFSGEEHLLAGEDVSEIVFPDSVEAIGNYIFYGCKELKRLEFSDSLKDIGSGAFTGCGKIEKLDVHMNSGDKSCVKEILGDLWQRIDVTFYYGEEIVKLVFPEHYEEAVENTPARILFTQHHGIGNNYRQCFQAREIDYRKYDELFPLALAQDKIEVLIDLVFSRLIYPRGLAEKNRLLYEGYINENLQEIIQNVISGVNKEIDKFTIMQEISRKEMWNRENLDIAVKTAVERKERELASWLMNERYRLFGRAEEKRQPKRKKFVL